MAGKVGTDTVGLLKFIKTTRNFDRVLNKIRILALGGGKCSAELKVDESHMNAVGGLHGGLSATLVDCITTYALMTQLKVPHVSVDIHISYLKGATKEDDLLIDASVIKKGKNLAFLICEIKNKKSGDILVKFISAGDGKLSVEMKIDESHLDSVGRLHTGFSTTLIDTLLTVTTLSQVGVPAVSVNLHTRFLKEAQLGDEIIVDAFVAKVEKRSVFLESVIKNKLTGEVLVKGTLVQLLATNNPKIVYNY